MKFWVGVVLIVFIVYSLVASKMAAMPVSTPVAVPELIPLHKVVFDSRKIEQIIDLY